MNDISETDIEEIGIVYVMANTPRYLYKRLRSLSTVQRMGEKLSVEELKEVYSKNQKKIKKSIEDVSLAYAALVALGFKGRPQFLESLETRGLDWASEIIDILKKTEWTSKIVTLDMPAPKEAFYKNAAANTSYTTKEIKNKPLIIVVRS